MKRRLATILAAVAFGLVAMGADSCDETGGGELGSENKGGGQDTATSSEPDGRFELTCDYLLGDFTEGSQGYRFVGGGEVENTGDVKIKVEARFEWALLGTDPITETETVKLKPGRSKNVQVTVPAAQDQIDAHQSANGKCKSKAKIVETL